jgi:hypothetical protein
MQEKFAGTRNIEFLTKPYTQRQLREALAGVGIGIP